MSARLIYHIATTLDGQIAHEDGSHSGFLMEGPHLEPFLSAVDGYSAVLMGRSTYEVGLLAGLTLGEPAYPGKPNLIFSHTLPSPQVKHHDVEFIRGDAIRRVKEVLKTCSGDVWLCGGGKLAASLINEGLVNEVLIKLNPVLFGKGLPLCAELSEQVALCLLEHHVYTNGVVWLRYELVNT